MEKDRWASLPGMFFDQATHLGDRPFLWRKGEGGWSPTGWAEAARQAAAIAQGLRAQGIVPGDRVVLVAENRPEWLIADIAIMAAGAITVPAYTTNRTADNLHILDDSGARGAIVSNAALADRLLPAMQQAAAAEFAITIDPVDGIDSRGIALHDWNALVAEHGGETGDLISDATALPRDATACLIYTSGTGGVPKGVMLSHGAILSNCYGAYTLLKGLGLGDEVFLSFLPLSHAYEHTAGQFFPIAIGAQIYYSEAESLAADLLTARPTIMTAVPRLYETMHRRILNGVARTGGWKARLFHRTVALGGKRYTGGRLGAGEWMMDRVGEALVRNGVRKRFGGRLKAMVSGGAPLNYDIGLFFTALGMRILQGYGQTESAPVISCNPPEHNRIDTVGPPVADCTVRIAEDGEIVVQGELVMQGYWNNADATAETIKDGWLHTGDIGEIDADGHIRITDRKKDIIVNSGGDNVAPQRIEGFLTVQEEIGQAMVYGDRKPHLVALIVPDEDFAKGWAAGNGKDAALAALVEDKDFAEAVGAAVDRVNRGLSPIEQVRRFVLTPTPFTIENGLMTPSLKIRRHHIAEQYGDRLEALYGGRS